MAKFRAVIHPWKSRGRRVTRLSNGAGHTVEMQTWSGKARVTAYRVGDQDMLRIDLEPYMGEGNSGECIYNGSADGSIRMNFKTMAMERMP